jgi:MFS family permease
MDAHKHFHLLQNKEIDELYINLGLRAFSFGLISIFIPLFLLNLGYPLFDVFLFFTASSFCHILSLIPAAYLSSKIGLKHTIIFAQPLIILYFILLFLLESIPIPIFIIGCVGGVYSGIFWLAFHSDFAENSDDGSKGKEVALGSVITTLLSAAAPVIGGLIIVYTNFSYLLGFVVVIILASVVPLLLTKDKKESVDFSINKIFAKRNKHHSAGYYGYGLYARGFTLFWPLILFSIVGSYVTLGLITTTLLVFSFIATIVFGSFFDKNKKNFISGSIFVGGVLWIIRLLVSTTIFAFIIDAIHGLVKPSSEISVDATTYSNAGENAVDYIIYREVMVHLGIMTCMLISLATLSLQLGLVIAAIGSFLMILLLK